MKVGGMKFLGMVNLGGMIWLTQSIILFVIWVNSSDPYTEECAHLYITIQQENETCKYRELSLDEPLENLGTSPRHTKVLLERSSDLSNSGEFKRQTAWDNAIYIHSFLRCYSDTVCFFMVL